MASGPILLGVIGRPHGVRGLVHVVSYTADPADLAAYRWLRDDQGRAWRLAWRAPGIAAIWDGEGRLVADRSAAERLTNLRLYIEREHLPSPGPDEFYFADLIGLAAFDEQGAPLGHVAAVHDYGAGASLELVTEGRPALLIPFTRIAVPEIDLAAGRVVVAPPAEIVGAAAPSETTSADPAGPSTCS